MNTFIRSIKTYAPLWYLLALSVLLATGVNLLGANSYSSSAAPFPSAGTIIWSAMGYMIVLLAFLKIIDSTAFAQSFKNYDWLSTRTPLYAQAYPYLELIVGLGLITMTADASRSSLRSAGGYGVGGLACALALLTGGSVVVYLLRQKSSPESAPQAHCACTGGRIKLPLGSVTIVENIVMLLMGARVIWSLASISI